MRYCFIKQQANGGGAGNQQQVQHATIEEVDDSGENSEGSLWYNYSNGKELWGSSTWKSKQLASAVSCSFNGDREDISVIQRDVADG